MWPSYGVDNHGYVVCLPPGHELCSSPLQCQDRLGFLPSLLHNGYRKLFPQGVKLTTHFDLVPRLRMSGTSTPVPSMISWPVYRYLVGKIA